MNFVFLEPDRLEKGQYSLADIIIHLFLPVGAVQFVYRAHELSDTHGSRQNGVFLRLQLHT